MQDSIKLIARDILRYPIDAGTGQTHDGIYWKWWNWVFLWCDCRCTRERGTIQCATLLSPRSWSARWQSPLGYRSTTPIRNPMHRQLRRTKSHPRYTASSVPYIAAHLSNARRFGPLLLFKDSFPSQGTLPGSAGFLSLSIYFSFGIAQGLFGILLGSWLVFRAFRGYLNFLCLLTGIWVFWKTFEFFTSQ